MSSVSTSDNDRLRRSPGSRSSRWWAVAFGVFLVLALASVAITKRVRMFQALHRPLASAVAAFEREGLTVGACVMLPRMPRVAQAIRLTVEGHDICLLEFDLIDPDHWTTLAGIHNSQSTDLLGEPQAAAVSKPLVMVGHDRHPESERLLKAFRSF